MNTRVKDIRDFIRILEEHPEWRAEVRRLILTEELLTLPDAMRKLVDTVDHLGEKIAALAEAQRRTEERLEALTARVDALAEAQRRTEERVDALAEAQRRTEERLEALTARVDALAEAQRRTEERLEALTARVDALAEAQRRTEERLEALTARVDALAEAQRRTEERLDALAEAQRRTEERLEALTARVDALAEVVDSLVVQVSDLTRWQRGEAGRREGERYERDIVRQAPLLFAGGRGGATDSPIVQSMLTKWLSKLAGEEKLLEETENPTLADLIWWKGKKVLLVEVSITVNPDDVLRCWKRTETLRSIGIDTTGVVIGKSWSGLDTKELAREKAIEWMVEGSFSEGLTAFRRLPP